MRGRRRTGAQRWVAAIVAACSLIPTAAPAASARAFDPPGQPALPLEASDPFPVVTNDGVFVFTTNVDHINVPVWSSASPRTGPWTLLGDALPVLPAWVQPGLTWSPGVVRATTGAWLLYFSALDRTTGLHCIGRAVAGNPRGPYQPTDGDTPFLCFPLVGGAIDPSPFLDPWDEQLYLYWKNDGNCCDVTTSLWGLKLTPDGEVGGPLVELLKAAAPWEAGVVERPAMVRWASGYHLFYSGGSWATPWYAEGWARCDGPLGPCTRQSVSRAWIDRLDVDGDGPGGMSIAVGTDGTLLAAWHAWPGNSGYNNGGSRRTYLGTLTMPAGPASDPVLHALGTTLPEDVPAPLGPLAAPSGLDAVTPIRVVDTRQAGTAVPRLRAGVVTAIPVGSVPVLSDARAVTANFTLTRADGAGYLTVWPCGSPEPDISVANVVPGVDVANGVTVGLAADGTLCVRSTVDTDLVVDVTGRWAPFLGDRFNPVGPRRLLDTRSDGPVAPGTVVRVDLAAAVPAGASGVALNVTATGATSAGYVTAWPCDQPRPDTSVLNVRRDETRANNVMLASGDGAVCLDASMTTHLIVDTTGYFAPSGASLTPVQPVRVADTRIGHGDVSRLIRDGTITVHLSDEIALPLGTRAVVVNVTAADPAAAGYLTAYPCGALPDTSTINVRAWGPAVPNGAMVAVSAAGDLCVRSSVPADVIVDVLGYLGT